MKRTVLTFILAFGASVAIAETPLRWSYPNMLRAEGEGNGFTTGRIYFSGGIGAVNMSAAIAKAVKSSIAPNWKSLEIDAHQVWFAKVEFAAARMHGFGLTFAQTGFDINAKIDSVTKYNVPVSGTLKYRTWSLQARYNIHFIPEGNFDLYAGLGLGLRANRFEVIDNDPEKDWWNFPVNLTFVTKRIPSTLRIPTVGADFTLGMRYFFTPYTALYAEFGLAKSIAQGGVTFGF